MTLTFSRCTKDVLASDDEMAVSFGITLLTLISLETLNIIQEYLNNSNQFTKKTRHVRVKLFILTKLVLTQIWYAIDNKFHRHTNGSTR